MGGSAVITSLLLPSSLTLSSLPLLSVLPYNTRPAQGITYSPFGTLAHLPTPGRELDAQQLRAFEAAGPQGHGVVVEGVTNLVATVRQAVRCRPQPRRL